MVQESFSLGFVAVAGTVHEADGGPIYSTSMVELLQSMGFNSMNEFSESEPSETGEMQHNEQDGFQRDISRTEKLQQLVLLLKMHRNFLVKVIKKIYIMHLLHHLQKKYQGSPLSLPLTNRVRGGRIETGLVSNRHPADPLALPSFCHKAPNLLWRGRAGWNFGIEDTMPNSKSLQDHCWNVRI